MTTQPKKPDLQDATGSQEEYYATGKSMKGFVRSLVIGSGRSTKGQVHVRDAIDVKRTMTLVGLCLLPAILFGLYNVGLQAQLALASGLSTPDTWKLALFNALSGGLTAETSVIGLFLYGLSFYLPIYLTALLTGLFWEVVFAKVRHQELHEGFFVTALLFTLILPVSIPLWLVVMGISFGVVIAKELFGGMGYNFLNPALAGLAFIYFAYPSEVTTVKQLVAVDGFSGATALAQAAAGQLQFADYAWYSAFSDPNWWNNFFGFTVGAIGETSTLAVLLGGLLLLITRLADWRIVVGVMLGMIATATLFNLIGSSTNQMMSMPWTWHLVTGGFAIAMMFMATDPVTTSYTRPGKFVYGALIGFMTVLIRVANPKMPEGVMLAILFANLWAPLFDYLVARANIKRRLKRHGI
ncbi:NADH:ubiquinone reductase (Na(+)-transporting) subunit B [Shewanella oneidensis MR-1]|uniref:Na(+)-translocating NADH-quinone reductase subunit B n=1 Tax=Shewanella oneidensis (strain ATCC 700550 / JCM 31522 / CIP 106686 / LMG 19005 / NCIMB 14063 / MR-1) TaxID=211586 RepID=Q8EID9_SHEON|nr:NADH:ubiquinone reductase (Na(+)-transporting) subunit B [Shewanella oneidensis]AAN53978.1 Na-translocating NADH-quinone reductase subunit B NqrB [Shewanella oneidensis MR-1]MDX5997203.1 NADH:ubiquinone reductase (Na(+)-transporting) subunit B [Shewanella oneidensis]MEE2027189.1 Na(+)-translocating NADH-quinone reductase subunit B [Shewanella oneidensis]QKG95748.1 NADH:ubiquinone reductase (Na(+)-transporting) subunit B [Shewanella oneidensis MR-1]